MEGIAQDASSSSYELMTPFRKESLCKNERKPVSEFISSESLTFKKLVSEKAYDFCFCDLPKGRLHQAKAEVERGTQHGITGEDEMELRIRHGLPRVQLLPPLTFIFNYIIISRGSIGYLSNII